MNEWINVSQQDKKYADVGYTHKSTYIYTNISTQYVENPVYIYDWN